MRTVLLITGLLVIAGVYIWGVYREKIMDFLLRRGDFDEVEFDADQDDGIDIYDENEYGEEQAPERREPHFSDTTQADRWSSAASRQPEPSVTPQPPRTPSTHNQPQQDKTHPLGAPFLIQVSIVSKNEKAFTGSALKAALHELGLVHGEMGIYHRMDHALKQPLFSVASLVEPGTFPVDTMERFESPGIVLFYQPARVPDPLDVFDNLLDTCHELSAQLDGIEWDETRQPLTLRKITDMRHRLSQAYETA
ncbi:MAG: hypothetical protein RLZZ226_875 [Pseudomonadota bacterium]